MKIGIFLKLLVTYIIVILMAITVLGALQMIFIKNYLTEAKQQELVIKSRDLAEVVKPLLIRGEDLHPVIISLNRADRSLGTEAWVIDKTGKLIATSEDHVHCEGDIERTDLEQLRAGVVSVRKGQSRYFDEAVIRVAAPMLQGEEFIGAVILYTPVTGIKATFARMVDMYGLAAFLSIALSGLVGFILSRNITRPLREVSNIAHSVAEGKFENRVTVKSKDELGQLGDAINHMINHLSRYEAMRRDFVANVSHELRSPLTSIRGFVDAVVEGKSRDADEQARYLSIVQQETHRLTKLVNELLEISRFDARESNLNMDSFPVEVVVNRAVASLKPQIEAKSIGIKKVLQNDLPLCYGDEDRIEQVVHNILENAVRYSEEGGNIIISVSHQNNEVVVEAADNGPGIPREALPRIWERFYRTDKARSRKQGGTGLGLAIVEEIIKKHGGRVFAESEPGKGTIIGFALPVTD